MRALICVLDRLFAVVRRARSRRDPLNRATAQPLHTDTRSGVNLVDLHVHFDM
jgi:hypothetical protein